MYPEGHITTDCKTVDFKELSEHSLSILLTIAAFKIEGHSKQYFYLSFRLHFYQS